MSLRVPQGDLTLRAAVLATSWLVRAWFGSVKFNILNREIYDHFIAGMPRKGNAVVATWHRHVIPIYYFFRSLNSFLIMGSQSKDGEFATRLGRRFGLQFTRGSSSRGGHGALEEMMAYLRTGPQGKVCSTPVDGPRGPARRLKKGMLILAKETDAFFIPMACSGKRVITFSRAWDQTILPLPFSEMFVDFHPPFKIPRGLSDSELEAWRGKAEDILNQLTDRVDRIVGYPTRV
jgi:lysophospholipid acyltransferase (LPLAT)-like uncharacterized protein